MIEPLSPAERLAMRDPKLWAEWLDGLGPAGLAELIERWQFWARPAQLAPAGAWQTWLILAGRGFGKTRAGAEWVRAKAEADGRMRIALIGATQADARNVMVEGESGLIEIAGLRRRPKWEPSLGRLTWPNGAMAGHAAGEPFVLIDAARLAAIALPIERIGGAVTVIASGPGDPPDGTIATAPIRGKALRPPSPVHCVAMALADGATRFAWTRRSRIGWGWTDGADAPLGEERERYRLTLVFADGTVRTIETDAPGHIAAADDSPIERASIVQLGDRGASRATAFRFD